MSEKGAVGESDYIRLRVSGADKTEMHFRVKKHTPLGKLKKSYAESIGVSDGTLRFLYDGKRIDDNETPKILQMESQDIIEVYQEQIGGFR